MLVKKSAKIALSNNSVSQHNTGGLVGVFSVLRGSGSYTFTLIDNAGGRFTVSGTNLNVLDPALVNYTGASGHEIKAQADNGVDTPIIAYFNVYVTQ